MLKKLFMIVILLGLAMGLALPVSAVRAEGANRVNFSYIMYSICPNDDFCNGGDVQARPNGEIVITHQQDVLVVDATDDRWTAICHFSADPFIYGKPNAMPLPGSFVCTPTDPKYAGGYWVGRVNEVFQKNHFISLWNAKGYGTFERLLATASNTMSSKLNDAPAGTTDVGVITELPGYVPVP